MVVSVQIGGQETIWDLEDALKYVGQSLHVNANGYLRHIPCWKGTREYVHREIMGAGADDYVDHINGNRLDNRRSNLRICTQAENMRNQTKRSDNKSGVTGVHYCNTRKRWISQIKANGKNLVLGRFLDFQDAVSARREAETKYYGEFAATNGVAKA